MCGRVLAAWLLRCIRYVQVLSPTEKEKPRSKQDERLEKLEVRNRFLVLLESLVYMF